MKFSRELHSTGRNEHAQLKDTSLHKAAVCLQCEKKKCIGTERCFQEVADHGKNTEK